MRYSDIGDVVAAAQIDRLDVGQTLYDVAQAAPQRQDLNASNPAPHQRREQGRVGAPQVQFRLGAAPNAAVVGGVAPTAAHLSHAAAVAYLQQPEDDGQDFRVQARDVGRVRSQRSSTPLIMLLLVLAYFRRLFHCPM